MSITKLTKMSLIMLFLLCLFPLGMSAQSNIKGTVSDKNGEPIIGATVRVVGTNAGTVTDIDGQFNIQAASNASLTVSYVGYETQTVGVNGRSFLNIVLAEDQATLDDVVVIGYGTMKKSDISGSVATVDQEAVMKRMPTNVAMAL